MRWVAGLFTLALALALAGCERAKQDMYDQARGKPLRASGLFPDGNMSRIPPAGTVPHAQGPLAMASSGRVGADATLRQAQADAAQAMPSPITPAMLRRGQDRYAIYCLPCHSPVGDGDGRIVRRGFPAPPTYHQDRLRNAPDRHIYDVISQGFGAMRPYGDRIAPEDRWAIVAYVRALQLSQHAQVDTLPPDVRGAAQRALDCAGANPPAQVCVPRPAAPQGERHAP